MRWFVAVATSAALSLVATVPAGAAAQAPGTGKPPAGTGIGTTAALANPLCDKTQGIEGYGKLDFVIKGGAPDPGGSPICVAAWKKGKDNGGATSQGVTKDKVLVVALVPNEQQKGPASRQPTNNATGQPGTVEDALTDALPAYAHIFESYGRTVDVEYVTSTGDDEAAQRADAVTVLGMKPFAVFDAIQTTSHPVFEAQIAGAKIPVFGNGATYDATQKQAPYRWGQADIQSSALNAAEFAGKQLMGKKAQYAGDESFHTKTRKLGLVYGDPLVDIHMFDKTLAKYGGKIDPAAVVSYPGTSSVTGDPTVAQEQAPTIVTKLKDAGVTTVILLADSAMVGALTKQATAQDYHPEWIMTSFNYHDLSLFARGYDQDQWAHAFGFSNLPPTSPTLGTASNAAVLDPVQWYWGKGKGTSSATIFTGLAWVMAGVMYAGPELTPKTFQQGLFAVPGAGGAPSDDPTSVQHGYGRTANLPYDEYLRGNQDFTAVWWDPDTLGLSVIANQPPAPGTLWYLDGAKRYYAGHWPTQPLTFFDESNAIHEGSDAAPPVPVPCKGCPSETGEGGSSTG
jgi:hypothetical protein